MSDMGELLAHLVGDYCLQTTWMVRHKRSDPLAALYHAAWYTLPFVLLTEDFWALVFICLSHALIDHYQLAKYVIWIKEGIPPVLSEYRVQDSVYGFAPGSPQGLSLAIFIVVDNTLHLLCNAAVLHP